MQEVSSFSVGDRVIANSTCPSVRYDSDFTMEPGEKGTVVSPDWVVRKGDLYIKFDNRVHPCAIVDWSWISKASGFCANCGPVEEVLSDYLCADCRNVLSKGK